MCFTKAKQTFLKDFQTLEELQAWFGLHDELRMEAPNLCDDYSRESRALAEADGYFLSLCLVNDGEVYSIPVMDKGVYHVANSAVITNTEEMWYVDLAFRHLVRLCQFYPGGKY